ncbi:hypothetical protein NPIL_306881, partial [Nephila pilipes]
KISGTENRKQSEIVTATPEEPEMMWYETIDYSQAPRLENNPFAYAYINNPFCGNDFPEMMYRSDFNASQKALPVEVLFSKNDGHCAAINDGGNTASANGMNEEAPGEIDGCGGGASCEDYRETPNESLLF